MDDFAESLENANECRIAKSDAGKSYDSQTWALRCLIEGLYFAKGIHIPMKVIASSLEHMLTTTNPREVAALLAESEEQKELLENIEVQEMKRCRNTLDHVSKRVA